MKRSRRSVAISLFVALAVASVFVVAIAGCSGSNDGASTSALEGLDASQVKDDDLKTLNVGSDLYPPFVYTDEYGDIVGLDVEILTEALARIGYKPKYQLIDWEKKKELLASGELDCVMGSFSMTGRENEYRWAGPYLASRQVVAVDPQSDIYTLADLEDKIVAVQSTTKPEDILLNRINENVPQIKELYSFSDGSYLNPALVEGLVDAIAAHESSFLTYEKDYGVTYRILDEPLLEVGLGTAFDINDTRGIDVKLTHAYQEMLADGTMERLVSKYFDDPSPFLNMEACHDRCARPRCSGAGQSFGRGMAPCRSAGDSALGCCRHDELRLHDGPSRAALCRRCRLRGDAEPFLRCIQQRLYDQKPDSRYGDRRRGCPRYGARRFSG